MAAITSNPLVIYNNMRDTMLTNYRDGMELARLTHDQHILDNWSKAMTHEEVTQLWQTARVIRNTITTRVVTTYIHAKREVDSFYQAAIA